MHRYDAVREVFDSVLQTLCCRMCSLLTDLVFHCIILMQHSVGGYVMLSAFGVGMQELYIQCKRCKWDDWGYEGPAAFQALSLASPHPASPPCIPPTLHCKKSWFLVPSYMARWYCKVTPSDDDSVFFLFSLINCDVCQILQDPKQRKEKIKGV